MIYGRAAGGGNSAAPLGWYSPSSLALVAANLLPLRGVLAWGWPVMLLGSPLWALVLLLAIKTTVDLKAHLKLHAKK